MTQCQDFVRNSEPIDHYNVGVYDLGKLLQGSCWFQLVLLVMVNFLETLW